MPQLFDLRGPAPAANSRLPAPLRSAQTRPFGLSWQATLLKAGGLRQPAERYAQAMPSPLATSSWIICHADYRFVRRPAIVQSRSPTR